MYFPFNISYFFYSDFYPFVTHIEHENYVKPNRDSYYKGSTFWTAHTLAKPPISSNQNYELFNCNNFNIVKRFPPVLTLANALSSKQLRLTYTDTTCRYWVLASADVSTTVLNEGYDELQQKEGSSY